MKRNWFPIVLFIIITFVITREIIAGNEKSAAENKIFQAYEAAEPPADTVWRGAGVNEIEVNDESGKLVKYGHDLISNTAYYLGPNGTVRQTTNGMNCQNCHLNAGTVPFGNNYGKVYSTYPQYRARNDGMQSIYDRVNDCFERSLNGKRLDTASLEMQAIYAYMKWLGTGVPKGIAKPGTSLMKLKYLARAASPAAGKLAYITNCMSCHGDKGQGLTNPGSTTYIYPPLWGEHSYNDGAGLYRISSFAGFVKNNMPFGTDYHSPKLTDEEAWDIAAFVNSQPRPHKDQTKDWRNITKKPIDFPSGPYIDSFSEQQHKFGPYGPIQNQQNKNQSK